MKKILIILIVFLASKAIYSQKNHPDDNLYLLMSTSLDLFTQWQNGSGPNDMTDTSFLSILWRVEGDTLISVDTLNFDHSINNEIIELRHFDENKWFFIKERKKISDREFERMAGQGIICYPSEYISVLDYSDNNLVLRKVDAKLFSPYYKRKFSSQNNFVIDGDLYYDYIQEWNDNTYGNYAINKYIKNPIKIDEYTYIHKKFVKRESAFYDHKTTRFSFSKEGKLVFNFDRSLPFEKWSELDYPILKDAKDGKVYAGFNFFYITPTSKYIIGYKNTYGGGNANSPTYIYDKTNQKWDSCRVNAWALKNVYIDEFAYGTLVNPCYTEKCNYLDSIEDYKSKFKNKYSEKYSFYPVIPWTSGKFGIFHIPTKKYIEFQAKDRDCEVIQIIDDWIYYRVYDELRRIKLNTDKVDFEYNTDELLYKDKDIIPNVHHVFRAKKQALKVEWITPKPEGKK